MVCEVVGVEDVVNVISDENVLVAENVDKVEVPVDVAWEGVV